MDLTSFSTIKKICHKYDIRPQKEKGQNFLIGKEILDKIIKTSDLKKDDVVLEIGPGFGVLTMELAKRAKKVVAVEMDGRLVRALREILKDYKNVEIIQGDILKLQITNYKLQNYKYKIVANLPYQITSAVFRRFLERESRPSEMTVMVQKEVAERICAKPGEMSLLSVSVQFFGKPEIVQVVPRTAFWPEPEVDSAILKISNIKRETERHAEQILVVAPFRVRQDGLWRRLKPAATLKRGVTLNDFFKIVKIGFSARRKQLHNNLSAGLRLPDKEVQKILIGLNFDPKIRAQDLGVDDWIRLSKGLKDIKV